MVFGALVGTLLLACAPITAQDTPAQRGRLAPPAAVSCERSQLTSWTGVVTAYQRRPESTRIEIHTDWETVESTVIDHAGATEPSAHYLLRGEPFSAADWPRIEQSEGRLIEGMRATAWICSDGGTPPVIDWQPRLD